MAALRALMAALNKINLVYKILIGIILGGALGSLAPEAALSLSFLGSLFVGALKAVAPILVFFLVISAIANHNVDQKTHMRPVLVLYLIGTMAAAFTAVMLSFIFPVTLSLVSGSDAITPPSGIGEVLSTLIFKIVQNPLSALLDANYIGIIAWGVGLGWFLRQASDTTTRGLHEFSDAITGIVKIVIEFAPLGIFGLVAVAAAETSIGDLFQQYGSLLGLLLSAMLFMALVVNPLLVYWKTRQNPYPLVFQALRESGVTAFFTRSSAANIPVNMQLCEKLELDEDTYSISIPLGATINMGGAAITITTMTMAAVHTLGINVDLPTAVLLSAVAALSACGASGVAGGSLLLIPLACSLFGISNDVAMQVVAVGFIIGVVQDSAETALNSSTDVVFTAAACREAERSA